MDSRKTPLKPKLTETSPAEMLARDLLKATVPDKGFTPPSGDIYLLNALELSPFSAKETENATKKIQIREIFLNKISSFCKLICNNLIKRKCLVKKKQHLLFIK